MQNLGQNWLWRFAITRTTSNTNFRFRVSLMGTALVDWCGRDFSGRYVDEITDQVLAPLHELVTSGEPWLVSGQYENITGRVMLYELLALPLSSDEATVNMILGGIAQVPLSEN